MTSSSEQTTALIAEARSWVADPKPEPGEVVPALEFVDLVGRLADALEAATSGTEWAYLNDDRVTAKYGPYDHPPRPAGGFVIGHRSVGPWVGGTE